MKGLTGSGSPGRRARRETVTLLFGSRETRRNNAAPLKEFLEKAAPRSRCLPARIDKIE